MFITQRTMFISQQCEGELNAQFLEWAVDEAETIGLNEEDGGMMYYSIVGCCSFRWEK